MAYLKTDVESVPGLEAEHIVDALVNLHKPQGTLPRGKCKRIDGLHSSSDLTDVRDSAFGRIGEVARPTLRRGKTITYEGELQAETAEMLRYEEGRWRAALSDPKERTVRIVPNVAYGGNTYYYKGRVLTFEMDDEASFSPNAVPSPWRRAFTVSIRQSDPRYYIEGSGATVVSPFHAGGNTITMAVNNTGTAPVEPTIKLYGPVNNPNIRRIVPGSDVSGLEPARLAFSFDVLAGGEWLLINFAQRTIVHSNGSNWAGKLDLPYSTWWDSLVEPLPVGSHDYRYWGGAGMTGATKFEVTFEKAVW